MSSENQKPKAGGISFDVILKPACNSPLTPRPGSVSPNKRDRPMSTEQIEQKLKKAEQRRSLIEQERLEQLAKERQKAIEVLNKAQCENENFSKKTKEKLRRSMEVRRDNRETQIRALQERLREHSAKVSDTQRAGEDMVREFEKKAEMKHTQKMSTYEENHQKSLKSMLAKLKEHAVHIKEVCDASENSRAMSDEKQEAMQLKMQTALKNKEEQLRALQERLDDHKKHMKEVQNKKMMSSSGDCEKLDTQQEEQDKA